jgi:hypothetical protein
VVGAVCGVLGACWWCCGVRSADDPSFCFFDFLDHAESKYLLPKIEEKKVNQ